MKAGLMDRKLYSVEYTWFNHKLIIMLYIFYNNLIIQMFNMGTKGWKYNLMKKIRLNHIFSSLHLYIFHFEDGKFNHDYSKNMTD